MSEGFGNPPVFSSSDAGLGKVAWLTGLSGAGKSTLARELEKGLRECGRPVVVLDGDELRRKLCAGLGYSPEDRAENIRRIAHVARLFLDSGFTVIVAVISPLRANRAAAREIIGPKNFLEIHVHCPLEVCRARDPKGLYAKADAGGVAGMTGLSAPYEPPRHPDLRVDTSLSTLEKEVESVLNLLEGRGSAVQA
jgi:adenylylsulfate kinase